jgi:RHS repeat-associated protein
VTGLPGTESIGDAYDANNRLAKSGSTAYGYDSAEDPTTLGSHTSVYDAGNQLKTSGATVYGYDQLGERVSASPQGGQATIYAYDQAGNLTQVKQGQSKAGAINDLYTYNGDGLRATQSKGKTTAHLTWDTHGGLPLILADEQNTYIYGPTGTPIEAVQSKGAVLYFHHDQQGSTRMLTGATGAIEATASYDAYGNPTGSTGTVSTPLGYSGQYTDTDTGLIYMRARAYDPATAQFLNVDPIVSITQTPYTYGLDNPLNFYDPSGLLFGIPGTPSTGEALSAVTGAIGSHAGTVLEGVGVGALCLAGPEVCVPAGLAAADLSVNSADVHAALHPEEAASLPSTVLQQLAAAGISALPTAPISEGVYRAYFANGAGAWAYRQLLALGTASGVGVSFLGGPGGSGGGGEYGEGPGEETPEEAFGPISGEALEC